MKKMFSSVLMGAFAVCTVAGFTAAKADVIRVAIAVADSQADYESNAALLPTFAELFKKGKAKAEYVGTDAAKMTIMSTSVWASEADVTAVTGSADWKAAAGKLKAKTYNTEVFELAH